MDEQVRQLLLSVFAADELLPPDLLAILDALTAPASPSDPVDAVD